MRKIKFRAWKHVNTPEMFNEVQGINFVGGIVHLGYRLSSDTVRTDKELLDNLILMQYTGLKDKNGKEIYEGDVFRDSDTFLWKVGYEDGMFVAKGGEYEMTEVLIEFAPNHCEVIGNIYENPELLEENK